MTNINDSSMIAAAANQNIQERDYWLDKLSGQLVKSHFIYDSIDSTKREMDSFKFKFDDEIYPMLLKLSNGSDYTLHMIMAAAVAALLDKYTRNRDIIMGSPIYKQDEDGDFINTVLTLRNAVSPEMSFKELLIQVRQTIIAADKNQNYPLEAMLYKLDMDSSDSDFPLFDVAVMVESIHKKSYIQHLNLNMLFSFARTDESIEGTVEYNSMRYERTTVERIVSHLVNLLRAAVFNLNGSIDSIEIVSAEEKKQVLYHFNNPEGDPTAFEKECPSTLYGLFEEQAAKTPENRALIYKNQCLSYSELNEKANRLARTLREKGVAAETIVGIMAERSVEMIIAMLSVLKAGGAYLPIDPEYPEDRIRYILEDSGVNILLAQGHLTGNVDFGGSVINLSDEASYSAEGSNLEGISGGSNAAYVIYTSGSTGQPKGTVIMHDSIANTLVWRRDYYKFGSGDCSLQIPSFSFDSSVEDIFTPLISGCAIVVLEQQNRLNLEYIREAIEKNTVTHFLVVPNLYKSFLQEIHEGLKGLKAVTIAGDNVLEALVKEHFEKLPGVELINEYGPTENSVCTTAYRFGEHNTKVLIGKPISNVACYILDADGKPSPIGVPGELCVSGRGLARGYLNRPEMTAGKFVESTLVPGGRMYKTGDLARWKPDGNIEFLGRMDNQVKIRGYRIELGEIENVLLKYHGIKEAVVTARENEEGEKYLCGYVVQREDACRTKATADELKKHIAGALPEYMVPSQFVFIDSIPLTPNGKIDRKALPAPESMECAGRKEYVAPRNEIEAALINIWEELLKIKPISVTENFFELGGHSVLAIQMVSRVKKQLKVNLSLKDFFDYPDTEKLAKIIEKNMEDSVYDDSLMKIAEGEQKKYYEISPIQYPEWFLLKLNPNSAFYNVSESIEIKGDLNVQAFIDSLNLLLMRHDVLRVSFVEVDGKPHMMMNDNIRQLTVDDIIDLRSFNDSEKRTEEIVRQCYDNIFKLDEPPVHLMKLIRKADDEYVYVFATNHILWDQLSSFNSFKEVQLCYNALVRGEETKLPELRINFIDYTRWINNLIKEGRLEKQRKYWLEQFAVLPEAVDLPTDFPRPPIQTFNGRTISYQLSQELREQIDVFCREHNISYQIFLLAVLNLLVHRIAEQNDFVIGTPIANRDSEELEGLLGLFASALPLRCTLKDDFTFEQLLEHTRQTSVEAYDNHLYPFNKVIEELHCDSDFSRQKVISVFFGVQNDETELFQIKLDGVQTKSYTFDYESGTTHFDFTMQVDYASHYMKFSLRYNTDLFKSSTSERMLNRYVDLVKQCMDNSNRKVGEYNLLVEEDEANISEQIGKADLIEIPDTGLHNIIEEKAREYPENVAVVSGDMNFTYSDVNSRANQLAHYLIGNGVGKNDRVAVLMPPSVELITALLGIMKAGAAYIPLSKEYPVNRIKEIYAQAGFKKIITSGECTTEELEEEFGAVIINLDKAGEAVSMQKTVNPDVQVSSEDSAYIIFTSGSTGVPKGIEIRHKGVISLIKSMQGSYELNSSDSILFCTPVIFDASILDIFWPLAAGFKIVVMEQELRSSVEAVAEYINKHGVSIIQTVPLMLEALAGARSKGGIPEMPSLKYVIVGAAILTKNLRDKFLKNFNCKLSNHYGPTEITVDAARFDCSEEVETDIVPVGRPVSNTIIYILDKHMNICPIGIPGEIYISSAGIAKGYVGNEELTIEYFVPNIFDDSISEKLYKTGDKGIYLEDRNILVLGRLDNQVKVNGNRIEIDEIESRLVSNDYISNAAVLLNKNESGYEQLIGFVEVDEKLNRMVDGKGNKYRLYTYAQNPMLKKDFDVLHFEAWPQYFSGSDTLKKYWNMLYMVFPEFQFAIVNEESKTVGVGNTVPIYWNGEAGTLPKGWDGAITKGFEDAQNNQAPNTLVILAGVIDSKVRGGGLSKLLIDCFRTLSKHAGFKHFIGIIRPVGKLKSQELSIEEYVNLKDEDGLCRDKWLKIHQNVGGTILKVETESQYVAGSTADWERWEAQEIGDSGDYYFKDTLGAVKINKEAGTGEYYDPGVWFDHSAAEAVVNWKHIDQAYIRQYLEKHLPVYMIPSKIIVVDNIPRLESGKNDKTRLNEMKWEFSREGENLPQNRIQEKLHKLFEEILERNDIGIYDSFFEMGGHSINSLVLLAKMEKSFGIKMPVVELFRNPSISKLAAYIKDNGYIENTGNSYLEQLSSGGVKNAVCIPSITTTPIEFMELAVALKGVNLYAVNMAMLENYDINADCVEVVADRCIDMITGENIAGPLTIIGYSTGARLGFEIAKKLEASGREMENLIVIDSAPNLTASTDKGDKTEFVESLVKSHPYYECLGEAEKAGLVSNINKYLALDSYMVNKGAIKAPISIIHNDEETGEAFKAWESLTQSKTEIRKGAGNHYELISKDFIELNRVFFEGILGK